MTHEAPGAAERLADYDYALPEELIAQTPAERRDGARLMVLGPQGNRHRRVAELPELIPELIGPALLVVNDTRVIPARVFCRKPSGKDGAPGGAVELLLCDPLSQEAGPGAAWSERWRCLYRSSKPLRPGAALSLLGRGGDPSAVTPASAPAVTPSVMVEENEGGGRVRVRFDGSGPGALLGALQRFGEVPLPPYIRRPEHPDAQDERRYQTVYARVPGSVAAPTAGLHFTEALLAQLAERGLRRAAVTLHVGPGTFAPVKDDDIARHVMHAERYEVPEETAAAISEARREGRKVLAVGTTVVRTLESATPVGERVPRPGQGESALFIRPPYRFRCVDAMLTNFHLPRSTLLMLVSALCGRRRTLAAYGEAVAARYRFFSYGDAMLIPSAMEDLPP